MAEEKANADFEQKIKDHLESRDFDLSKHIAWINEEERIAQFPLLNLSGQMIGFINYRPDETKEKKNNPYDGRYFIKCTDKRIGVWGLESWKFSNPLYVVEGVFDATRLTSRNQSAIAVLSCAMPEHMITWLNIISKTRPIIIVKDEGVGGNRITEGVRASEVIAVEDDDLGAASVGWVEDLICKISAKYG